MSTSRAKRFVRCISPRIAAPISTVAIPSHLTEVYGTTFQLCTLQVASTTARATIRTRRRS